MKKGKKILKNLGITLGVVIVLMGAAFVVFHDDTDLDEVEREQQADIDEVVPDKFDDLNNSFEE